MSAPEDSQADVAGDERTAADFEECAACKHYPAYHDVGVARGCRAWDPDKSGGICACKGWKKKPTPVQTPEPA